jgi:hypothetical protein
MGTKIYANPHVSMSKKARPCTADRWASDKVIRHASKDTDVQSVTGARIGAGVRNIFWIFSLSLSFIAKMFNSTPWKTTMWSNGFKWDERTSVTPLMPHPSHPMASPCRRSWRRHRPGLNAGGKADSSFWQSSLRNHRSSVRCKMCKI